jgi:Cu+-exporting ATPase
LADKFSVDDILSEYSDKKSQETAETEENIELEGSSLTDKLREEISEAAHEAAEEAVPEDSSEEDSEEINELTEKAEKRADETAQAISNISKHKKNKVERSSGNVPPVNRANLKNFKMELTGMLIPKTEEFDKALIPDNATYEEKAAALSQHRKKKVESFVLKAESPAEKEDEKPSDKPEEHKTVGGQREFESFDEAADIFNDILRVKSNIFLRLCILLVTGIASVLITAANDFELPMLNFLDRSVSPSAYLFVNTILGLISIAVSYNIVIAGVKSIFKKTPDSDSIAAMGSLITVIVGIITLFSPESLRQGYYHVYISVGIVGLIFNTIGKYMIVQRTEQNFRYVAGEFDRYAVRTVNSYAAENFTRGSLEECPRLAAMRKTEFVKDFMKHSYSTDVSDKYSSKLAPIIAVAGLIVGVLSFLLDKTSTDMTDRAFAALAAFSGTLTLCSTLSLALVVNIPLNKASRKFLQFSSVMLGYSAVDEFAETNSMLVEAENLFPSGMVDFVNLKVLSTAPFEESLLMAASLSHQAGSILKHPFYKILRGKTEMLYPVESYIYEDGMGLSGWIDNKRVLLGNRKLMESHSVDGLPTHAKEAEYAGGNQVVYLSVSGVATMLFTVTVNPSLSVSKWLQELESEGIITVIRTVDSFLSEDFLSRLFEIDKSSVKLLPFRYHKDYETETGYAPKESSSMLCSGHFPSFAMLVVGAKRLKSVAHFGIAVQIGAVVLGIIIALMSVVTGVFSQLTATVVLLYNLIFVLVTMLTLKAKNI